MIIVKGKSSLAEALIKDELQRRGFIVEAKQPEDQTAAQEIKKILDQGKGPLFDSIGVSACEEADHLFGNRWSSKSIYIDVPENAMSVTDVKIKGGKVVVNVEVGGTDEDDNYYYADLNVLFKLPEDVSQLKNQSFVDKEYQTKGDMEVKKVKVSKG